MPSSIPKKVSSEGLRGMPEFYRVVLIPAYGTFVVPAAEIWGQRLTRLTEDFRRLLPPLRAQLLFRRREESPASNIQNSNWSHSQLQCGFKPHHVGDRSLPVKNCWHE